MLWTLVCGDDKETVSSNSIIGALWAGHLWAWRCERHRRRGVWWFVTREYNHGMVTSPVFFFHLSSHTLPFCGRRSLPLTHSTLLYYAKVMVHAVSTLALEYEDLNKGDNPVLQPFQVVSKLVRLAMTSSLRSIRRGPSIHLREGGWFHNGGNEWTPWHWCNKSRSGLKGVKI